MPDRVQDENGIPHIASDAVPTTTLYDLMIMIVTHARNMQILMADPVLQPYQSSLLTIHEDLVWMCGIMQMAFGITPEEVIDYSQGRREAGAFKVTTLEEIECQKKELQASTEEHHQRIYQ